MERDQGQKHCCRFCNKSFPCGRSLGGHMRSHLNNSPEAEEKAERKTGFSSGNGGSSGNGEGYGLRENPKKTWRLSDSSDVDRQQQSKLCRECGKAFPSWKALFGHMRCHSDKSVHDDSWTEKMVVDSQSDNEAVVGAAPRRGLRSRRTRYAATTSGYSSIANGSSSVSEIEQEQEDVAISLMMLSRDVGSWCGIDSALEFSDNNSAVPEVKSSVITRKGSELGASEDRCLGNACKKTGSDGSDAEIAQVDIKSGKVKLEYEVSTAELSKEPLKLNKSEFSCTQLGTESCWKKKGELNCARSELGKKEAGFNQDGSGKRAINVAYGAELGSKRMKYEDLDSDRGKEQRKRSRYECTACNKTFHSYQALGGHMASHKKLKGCSGLKIESSENTVDNEASPEVIVQDKVKTCKVESLIETGRAGETSALVKKKKKKSRSHECPICFKVFASGQALGGHKRSHLAGNSDITTEACQTIAIQQQEPDMPDLLDLNLPAPNEEDDSGFKSWWIGSSHKHEPLMGMISN